MVGWNADILADGEDVGRKDLDVMVKPSIGLRAQSNGAATSGSSRGKTGRGSVEEIGMEVVEGDETKDLCRRVSETVKTIQTVTCDTGE